METTTATTNRGGMLNAIVEVRGVVQQGTELESSGWRAVCGWNFDKDQAVSADLLAQPNLHAGVPENTCPEAFTLYTSARFEGVADLGRCFQWCDLEDVPTPPSNASALYWLFHAFSRKLSQTDRARVVFYRSISL